MDSKQILSVMKKTKAIVNGPQKTGLLPTGQDPLFMNDPDLVLWIQNAGIEDYEEVFDTIGLEVTHGGLAAMAFATSEVMQAKSHDPSASRSRDPPAGNSFIDQSQQQPVPPGSSTQVMMDPQLIQVMAEAVKASLMQDGWKAPGQETPTSFPSVPAVSVKQEVMDTTTAVAPGPSAGHEDTICQFKDRNELPASVRLPENVIQRIFNGVPEKIAQVIRSTTISDKESSDNAPIGEINYTLRYHKIQSFEISSGPLNIEAVKASDSYTLTIEQIHFKVSAEFKYKVNLFGIKGPKGTGSYDVVGKDWSITITFRFDVMADQNLQINLVSCVCNENEPKMVNLNCSAPQIMSSLKKTPETYVRRKMRQKLEDASQTVIHQSARDVLKTVTYKGTKNHAEMQKVYPDMPKNCVLKVCDETLRNPDLRGTLMKLDPNIAYQLPDDVVSENSKQEIRKTNAHNPTVQARSIFIEAMINSLDPTKMLRLLNALENNGLTLLYNEINRVHMIKLTQHRKSCDRCRIE